MYIATQLQLYILEQTHAVYNAAWVVNDSYIASYCFPILFMSISTGLCIWQIINQRITDIFDSGLQGHFFHACSKIEGTLIIKCLLTVG